MYLFLQKSEFSQSVGVDNLSLQDDEVLIVWKWSWEEDNEEVAEMIYPEAEATTTLSEQEENSEGVLSDGETEKNSLVYWID